MDTTLDHFEALDIELHRLAPSPHRKIISRRVSVGGSACRTFVLDLSWPARGRKLVLCLLKSLLRPVKFPRLISSLQQTLVYSSCV